MRGRNEVKKKSEGGKSEMFNRSSYSNVQLYGLGAVFGARVVGVVSETDV